MCYHAIMHLSCRRWSDLFLLSQTSKIALCIAVLAMPLTLNMACPFEFITQRWAKTFVYHAAPLCLLCCASESKHCFLTFHRGSKKHVTKAFPTTKFCRTLRTNTSMTSGGHTTTPCSRYHSRLGKHSGLFNRERTGICSIRWL